MTVEINQRGFEHAKQLISEGRTVADERLDWPDHRPDAEKQDAYMTAMGFSWVGVSTDDFERSLRFYRDLLGLEVWVAGGAGDPEDRLRGPARNLRTRRSREAADVIARRRIRGG